MEMTIQADMGIVTNQNSGQPLMCLLCSISRKPVFMIPDQLEQRPHNPGSLHDA